MKPFARRFRVLKHPFLAATGLTYFRPLARVAIPIAAFGFLTLISTSYARQTISSTLPDQPGKSTDDGTPIIDSFARTGAYGSHNSASVSATLSQSDLSVDYAGDVTTYGFGNTAGSVLDLWAYNKPGQTGTVFVIVTPYVFVRDWGCNQTGPGSGSVVTCDVTFSLSVSRNYTGMAQRSYRTTLCSRVDEGVSVSDNRISPYTLSASDGDVVSFNMAHSAGVSLNYWSAGHVSSVAWYTVEVSDNGYLSTGPRDPANPPIPVLPPIRPQCTSTAFSDASSKEVAVSGTGGPVGVPLPYYVMSSTDAAAPLSSWTPFQTNQFDLNGAFAFRFPVNNGEPQRFYQVKLIR